ncbi:MAG: hypothetical protein ACI399_02920 [Candidatus Cryptobacteroides sp.]
MYSRNLIVSFILTAVLVWGAAVSCQSDDIYDADILSDISLSMKLFEEGIEFPLGEIEPVTPAYFGLESYPAHDVSAVSDFEIPRELRTAIKYGPFGIKGKFISTIPYTITLTVGYLDESGNLLDLNTESDIITIPTGDSETGILIRARSLETVRELSALRLGFVLHAEGVPGPVGRTDRITGSLSAFFPEGVNVNPDE